MRQARILILALLFFDCLLGARAMARPGPILQQMGDVTTPSPDFLRNRIIPILLISLGVGITGMWTADIVLGKFSDRGGFFNWREGENMLWPHISAELLMAIGLIMGGAGLYGGKGWGLFLSLAALGALTYSSVNSSGWVIADKKRLPYGVPMWISLGVAILSLFFLIS
ncbi:MAG: hypothetical protein V2I46_14845 [Bacteroides sp.]|jgi:hypothetical protein|nr:hypothetical protein [Bacteroides sp.]